MKRVTGLLLLLVSAVPGLLAGTTIYHCRATGWHGLVCGCETVAEVPAGCCSSSSPCNTPAPAGDSCDCCDVTVYRVTWAPTSALPEVHAPVETGTLPLSSGDADVLRPGFRGSAESAIGAVRAGPPLYLENSAYLL